MAITAIGRDWGNDIPCIVRITSTSTLAQVGTAGYLTAQATNIAALNNGAFEWITSDFVLCYASDGWGFFSVTSDFASLTAFAFTMSVTTPVIVGHIAVYNSTGGNLSEDAATAINGGNIQAGLSGTAGYLASFPATGSKGSLRVTAVANTGDTLVTISNAAHGQATVVSIPDSGQATTSFVLTDNAGTQTIATGSLALTVGSVTATAGNLQAGSSGHAGTVTSFPSTAAKGSLKLVGVANTGNTNTTISNAAMGQATVVSIPDPGATTANFVLDAGTAASLTVTTANITNLKYGATPVAQVDPASCTISGAAGAANTCTVTIQLKDGSGANIAYSSPFRVYSSSASNGLTLASAASTGYSVASGGLSLVNGAAVTTQINGVTSATGGCVLSLLDTGKQTSYLVLVLHNGVKISAQLSSGSYG